MEAKQTPLIELLERVPQDARVVVEHDQFSSTSHPVGRLCHEAVAALRAALAEPQTAHWEGCEDLRDYFAAKAMAVVMPSMVSELQKRSYSDEKTTQLKDAAANACYGIADAMLKARSAPRAAQAKVGEQT